MVGVGARGGVRAGRLKVCVSVVGTGGVSLALTVSLAPSYVLTPMYRCVIPPPQARSVAPCIIFIDELDAVGCDLGGVVGWAGRGVRGCV